MIGAGRSAARQSSARDVRTTIHFVRARDAEWLARFFVAAEPTPAPGGGFRLVVPEWVKLMQRTVRRVD